MSDLEQYAKEHQVPIMMDGGLTVSYTHLRAHET